MLSRSTVALQQGALLMGMQVGFLDSSLRAARFVFSRGEDSKPVFTIHADGQLEAGEGLSPDEATQALFAAMLRQWPDFLKAIAKTAP